MSSERHSGPASRPDPRRIITGTKIATVVGSAVGFGAVAGLVVLHPGGVTATTAPAPADPIATQTAPQQPPATPADDFFSPPPGFSAQPPLVSGGSGTGQGGSSSNGSSGSSGSSVPADGFGQGGFGQGGFGQGGFGGQMPGMRSGGS